MFGLRNKKINYQYTLLTIACAKYGQDIPAVFTLYAILVLKRIWNRMYCLLGNNFTSIPNFRKFIITCLNHVLK